MFAGVASILLNEDNTIITGIASREGEEVVFNTPVSTVEHPKINEWLSMVEKEMRVTLASNLTQAVQDIKQFKDGIDSKLYMEWVDKYQAQIVVLAAQIFWSEDVEAALGKMNNEPQKGPLEKVNCLLLYRDRAFVFAIIIWYCLSSNSSIQIPLLRKFTFSFRQYMRI